MLDLFNQGLSITEIARRTGHSRTTVRKYINSQILPVTKERSNKPSKLDDYKEYIIGRLHEYPLTAKRIYREIQERGFTGKYTIVKDFVREVRPKVGVSAIYRYETKPGVQAQIDWGECGPIEIDGERRKLYFFTIVLGYSRMRYAEFTLRMDVHTLIQCHLNAFQYFGGYTKEILYDNMKQIVTKRASISSNSTWNSQFEDFFKHYGFIPRLCRPYRPQTKGKIENNVGYVKRDFLLGSEFDSFSSLNTQVRKWLVRVNSEVHGTTGEIPIERLKQEGLKQLDAVPPYQNIREETRMISRDAFVSYLGNRYSVPYRFAGLTARLQISDTAFSVIVGSDLVCTHDILPGHGRVSRNKDHFRGLLSEILKQNSGPRKNCTAIFKFSEPDVEHRPLSEYEALIQEVVR
ncbi:Integrase core domain protein [uncultured archaeon]|nr:Integrase core domain protein [uncultured archaeon]